MSSSTRNFSNVVSITAKLHNVLTDKSTCSSEGERFLCVVRNLTTRSDDNSSRTFKFRSL